MSQIHFIGGEKGGVGKSTVARLLVQHCIDEKRDFAVLDADQSHGEMRRFYADFARSVNLQDDDGADLIFEAASEREQSVIIDLPAQSQHRLNRWFAEAGILELAGEHGIAVTFWHVMDDGKDSVALLERLLDNYAGNDNVGFVVVKNEGVGAHFRHLEQSQTLDKARRLGARFLVLPALNRKVMNKIDHMDLSFWAAAFRAEGDSLSLLERQRVKVWRKRWNEQLVQIADRLTPPRRAGVVKLHAAE